MAALFKVDGRAFSVGVTKLTRQVEIRDGGNAGNVLSGRYRRDIIGIFYTYILEISAAGMSQEDYDALQAVLISPVESHLVTMPDGQGTITYEAYVQAVNDALEISEDTGNQWGNMTVEFRATAPQRRP